MDVLIVIIIAIVFFILIVCSLNTESVVHRIHEKAKEAARQDRKEIYERELAEYNSEVDRAIALGLPIPERNLTFEFDGTDWVRTSKGKAEEIFKKNLHISTLKNARNKLISCPCGRDLSRQQ